MFRRPAKLFMRHHDLTSATDKQLTEYRRDHVGFVFQFYNLIPSLTALENVQLITEIAKNPMKPEDALEVVGLHVKIESLSRGALGRRTTASSNCSGDCQAARCSAL